MKTSSLRRTTRESQNNSGISRGNQGKKEENRALIFACMYLVLKIITHQVFLITSFLENHTEEWTRDVGEIAEH